MWLKCLQFLLLIQTINPKNVDGNLLLLEPFLVEAYDMTRSAKSDAVLSYYNAVEKKMKMCDSCGYPDLGTVVHLQYGAGRLRINAPADLKVDNLVTRLQLVNLTHLTRKHPSLSLSKEMAMRLPALERDPQEPTLLLFQFGWKQQSYKLGQCNCSNPGLSFEAAEWIASNLSHVTGVATDTPALESEETRDEFTKTVANSLGRNGIYMIENVVIPDELPESSCLSISMPQKIQQPIVPTRLTAYCPVNPRDGHTILTVRTGAKITKMTDKHDVEPLDIIG